MAFNSELEMIAAVAGELPAAIWVGTAPRGECVYVNRAFEEILGMRPPESERGNWVGPYGIHTRTGEVYPEDRMPFERAMRARATVTVDDLVIHRHDGSKVYLRVFAKPLFDSAGHITHVIEAFIDISREIVAEQGRAEGEARLRQAQRMESIGTLAGGVAHDFNNFLATIKVLASLLRMTEAEPTKLKTLAQIDQVTDSAVKLTRSLLGFARRGKNLAQRVSVTESARSVIELVSRTIDRRIEVSFEDATARGGDVVGDATQIEQVIMNLALNARDAVQGQGQIMVKTYDRQLDQAFAAAHPPLEPGPHVVLEVADTGTGIEPALRERIFEPYFTTKNTDSTKGTGLGLAVVYGVMQSHRGAVVVDDNRPNGTVMRAFFPAAPGERPSQPAPEMRRAVRPGQGTVLLVDDEELVRQASARALSAVGYQVIEARDGVEAVELFRQRRADVCAVVLDMIMPRMGGRETYLALRGIEPDVPVLLVTGFALNEEAQAILDLGVRGFLAKPYDVEALSQAVARVLGGG